MKVKTGIILFVLTGVFQTQGMNRGSVSDNADPGSKLIAQNTEKETQKDFRQAKLDELNQKCNEKVTTLEMADKMLSDARSISLIEKPDGQGGLNDEQGDILLKAYRKIADIYATNYRFKPAYIVYDEYINLKNSFLEIKKSRRLERIQMETNQLKNENKLKLSANEEQLTDLQSKNESLLAAKRNVYRTIWIVVLIVAFCSGAFIRFINHKYNKAKEDIAKNRNRMMQVAFISAIGEFGHETGKDNSNSYFSNLEQLKTDVFKFCDSVLSLQNKDADRLKSLLSGLRESIAKL